MDRKPSRRAKHVGRRHRVVPLSYCYSLWLVTNFYAFMQAPVLQPSYILWRLLLYCFDPSNQDSSSRAYKTSTANTGRQALSKKNSCQTTGDMTIWYTMLVRD